MFEKIHENEEFIVVDKFPGVSFHREGENAFFDDLRDKTGIKKLYAVHRLDKPTSGLLLIGKSQTAARGLTALFQAQAIEKYYLGISDRRPKKKQGLVAGDMAPARRGDWKLMHSRKNPAQTQFFSRSIGNGLRLFLLKPATGRTHQLRVAMKSIGAPVLGDDRYYTAETAITDVDRCYLHAYILRFNFSGSDYVFRSSPSSGNLFQTNEVTAALQEWKDPWQLPWPVLRQKKY